MSIRNKTYYALLGIDQDASTQSIDTAFRQLQKEYRSTGNGKEVEERLALIAEAHACLSNPLRRRIYDNQLADRGPVVPVASQVKKRSMRQKPIVIVLALLLVIGAGLNWMSHNNAGTVQSALQNQNSEYGKILLQSYTMPDEAIAAYNEAIAKFGKSGSDSIFALSSDWTGDSFNTSSDRNPYRMVIKVDGKAQENGTVSTRWQPLWGNRGPRMGSLILKDARAGQTVKLEGASPPVSFTLEHPTTPVLQFMEARNIRISSMTVEIWSGQGESTGFENMYVWSALLVPLIFLGFKLWGRRR